MGHRGPISLGMYRGSWLQFSHPEENKNNNKCRAILKNHWFLLVVEVEQGLSLSFEDCLQ